MVLGSSPVAVTSPSDFAPVSSKEFLDIQATIECGFTLKRVRDMTRTYSQYILFIGCLYYLSLHFHSWCFYIQYHRGIGEITSMLKKIFCFNLCSILSTWWRNIRLFYNVFVLTIQKIFRFEPRTTPLSFLKFFFHIKVYFSILIQYKTIC